MKPYILILLITLSTCAKTEQVFTYYDLNLNEKFNINVDENSISAFEYTDKIHVCKSKEKYACFDSEYFSFSIPKNINRVKSWKFNKALYCVIGKSYDLKDKSLSLIINFGYKETCNEISKSYNKIVFNNKLGLRFVEGKSIDGFPIKVISTDQYGFAGNYIVKAKL